MGNSDCRVTPWAARGVLQDGPVSYLGWNSRMRGSTPPAGSRRTFRLEYGVRSTLALVPFALLAPPLNTQDCLEVRVVDPSGASIPTATVSIGDASQPTDDNGIASFCGLGDGPHELA